MHYIVIHIFAYHVKVNADKSAICVYIQKLIFVNTIKLCYLIIYLHVKDFTTEFVYFLIPCV